jgi:hypothetical protein
MSPELLAQLLHLPRGCEIKRVASEGLDGRHIQVLVEGEALPEKCEHQEGNAPVEVTPCLTSKPKECGCVETEFEQFKVW